MIGVQVLLSVPAVEIVSRARAARMIGEREASELVVVQQNFTGAFAGRALLIFPQENGRELVRAVAGEELSDRGGCGTGGRGADGDGQRHPERLPRHDGEPAAAHARLCRCPRSCGATASGSSRPVGDEETDALVLFLYINFAVRERDIRGYIAMLMDLPSLESLKTLIDGFIERALGETESVTHAAR